jgi:hypothetical protein
VWLPVMVCLAVAGTASGQTAPGTASPGDPFEIHGQFTSGSASPGFLLGDAWPQGAAFAGVLDDDGNPTVDPETGLRFRASRLVDENWGNEGDGFDPSIFAGSNKNADFINRP